MLALKILIISGWILFADNMVKTTWPPHWWAAVPTENAPAWEVLPQEAKPGEVILSKRHELGLLSNFAATPFEFHGIKYASLEGFWQAMLYPENEQDPRAKKKDIVWKYSRAQVSQMVAFEAKNAGDLAFENMKKMKINWVSFEGKYFTYWPEKNGIKKGKHYNLIREATIAKLEQNPKAKAALLATYNLKLRPDHHQEKNAPPAWRYFDILMELREKLH